MQLKTEYSKEGKALDHTAASAITAGDPTSLSGKSVIGVPQSDIASGKDDSLEVSGIFRGWNDGSFGNVGDNVWYDSNGDPLNGTAGTGAYTTDATLGDYWVGTLAKALVATDEEALIRWGVQNPDLPAWSNRTHVKTAVDLTYVAATHSGMVIHVTADAKTITLPVGVVGMETIIVNDVADAGNLLTVDLNGNETIQGNLTIAATKTALLTKATSKRGDFLHLVCTTAAGIWRCVEKRGTWVTSA